VTTGSTANVSHISWNLEGHDSHELSACYPHVLSHQLRDRVITNAPLQVARPFMLHARLGPHNFRYIYLHAGYA
jgi:hypothetical protein